MELVLVIIAAFFMGFLAAIPAGPVQIEVVRRAINGHLKSAFMVVLGAFLSDVFYGAIAFFGIAPFLEDKKIMAVFWLAGGILLAVLGVTIIRQGLRQQKPDMNPVLLKRKKWAFLGGVSLSGINPMMILWWLSGVHIFRDIGLIREFTPSVALAYLAAGSIGLASYLTTLSIFLYWAKRFISERKLQSCNTVFGVLLLLLAGYFLFTSLKTLSRL
ncbi:MAG TPA: LysE family transporter [Dissulfurispiraceae bacterium]